MRFRTQVSNVPLLHSAPLINSVSSFSAHTQPTEIVRSLATLSKSCVIRLSPDKVHFIIPGNENKDGVQVWS